MHCITRSLPLGIIHILLLFQDMFQIYNYIFSKKKQPYSLPYTYKLAINCVCGAYADAQSRQNMCH